MYRCLECGAIFDSPKRIEAEIYYGVSSEFNYNCGEYIYCCPFCEGSIERDEDYGEISNVEWA